MDWSENPWKNDLPGSRTSNSRTYLEHTNEPKTELSFADGAEIKGYICEDVS